jgi:hypothetical protein
VFIAKSAGENTRKLLVFIAKSAVGWTDCNKRKLFVFIAKLHSNDCAVTDYTEDVYTTNYTTT